MIASIVTNDESHSESEESDTTFADNDQEGTTKIFDVTCPTAITCSVCSSTCGSVDELRAHLSAVHLKWFPFECAYCRRQFATKETASVHMDDEHPGRKRKFISEEHPVNQAQLTDLIWCSLESGSSGKLNITGTSADAAEFALPTNDEETTDPKESITSKDPVSNEIRIGMVENVLNSAASQANSFDGQNAASYDNQSEDETRTVAETNKTKSVVLNPVLPRGSSTRQHLLLNDDTHNAPEMEEVSYYCKRCEVILRGSDTVAHMTLQHLSVAPLQCFHCRLGFTDSDVAKNHILKEHTGKAVKLIDNRQEYTTSFFEEMFSELLIPLSQRYQAETDNSDHQKVACRLCDEQVDGLTSHVVAYHVDRHPFECTKCVFGGETVSEVREHVRATHRDDAWKPMKVILDNRECFNVDVEKLKIECFGKELVAKVEEKIKQMAEREPEKPKRVSTIQCRQCCVSVTDRPSLLRAHIVTYHLPPVVYKCSHCDEFGGSNRLAQDLCEHLASTHPDKDQEVLDKAAEYADLVIALGKTLFDRQLTDAAGDENGTVKEGKNRTLLNKTTEAIRNTTAELKPLLLHGKVFDGETIINVPCSYEELVARSRIECGGCGQRLTNRSINIRNHITVTHLPQKTITCAHCSFGVHLDRTAILQHLATAHPQREQEFVDRRSDYAFLIDRLAQDYFQLVPGESYVANQCGWRRCQESDCGVVVPDLHHAIDLHIRYYHLRSKSRQCAYCDYGGRDESVIEQHIIAKHPSQSITIIKSRQRFAENMLQLRERLFNITMDTKQITTPLPPGQLKPQSLGDRRTLNCIACAKAVDQESLSSHVYTAHMCDRPFSCIYCNFGAGSVWNIRRHVTIQHADCKLTYRDCRDQLASTMEHLKNKMFGPCLKYSNEVRQPMTIPCDECDMAIEQTASNFKQHILDEHMPEKLLHCALCPPGSFAVNSVNFMELHNEEIHTGVEPQVIDKRDEYEAFVNEKLKYCFPHTRIVVSATEILSENSSDCGCLKCGMRVKDDEEWRLLHIREYHLPEGLFQCRFCTASQNPTGTTNVIVGFARLRTLNAHHLEMHTDQPFNFIDNRPKYSPLIEQLLNEYFLDTGSGKSEPLDKEAKPVRRRRPRKNLPSGTQFVNCGKCGANVVNRSANRNIHVRVHHLPEFLFYCRLCPDGEGGFATSRKTQMNTHHANKHPDMKMQMIDNRPKYLQTIARRVAKYFSNKHTFLRIPIQVEKAKSVRQTEEWMKCDDCGMRMARTRHAALHHVRRRHLPSQLIICRLCPPGDAYGSYSLYRFIKYHFDKVHQGHVVDIIDNREKYGPMVCELARKCFPTEKYSKRSYSKFGRTDLISCDECGMSVVKAPINAKFHISQHHLPEMLFVCDLCPMSCSRIGILADHFKTNHKGAKMKFLDNRMKYSSLIAEKKLTCFPTLFALSTKVKQEGIKQEVLLPWKPNRKQYRLRKGLKRENTKYQYVNCPQCDTMVCRQYSTSLKYHAVRYHLDDKQCRCVHCDFQAIYAESILIHFVQEHKTIVHPEFIRVPDVEYRPLVVNKVRELFDIAIPESAIKKKAKTNSYFFTCPECKVRLYPGNSSDVRNTMKRHIIEHHLPEKLLTCVHCGFGCSSSFRMWNHLWKVHPQSELEFTSNREKYSTLIQEKLHALSSPRLRHIKQLKGPPESSFKCSGCGHQTSASSASRHIDKYHSDEVRKGESTYRCTLCQFEHSDCSDALQHTRQQHSEEANDAIIVKHFVPNVAATRNAKEVLLQTLFQIKRPGQGNKYYSGGINNIGGNLDDGKVPQHDVTSLPTVHAAAKCQLCNEHPFNAGTTPFKHVYYRHFTEPRYFCDHCDYKCPTIDQRMYLHMARTHPDKPRRVYTDKWTEIKPLFESILEKCFPPLDKCSLDETLTSESKGESVKVESKVKFPDDSANESGFNGASATTDYVPLPKKRRGRTSAAEKTERVSKPLIQCPGCDAYIRPAAKRYHVLQYHLGDKTWLYVCPYCEDYGNQQKVVVQTHVARMHPEEKWNVIDKSADYTQKLLAEFERLFPSTRKSRRSHRSKARANQ